MSLKKARGPILPDANNGTVSPLVVFDGNCHMDSVYCANDNSYPIRLDKELDFDGTSKRQ